MNFDQHIEEQVDIRDYIRVLYKRRWIIIAFFSIIVMFTAIYSFTAVPIYQATSRIVIEKENPNLVSIQEVMAVDATGLDYYQTQYKIIESRAVAREVIKKMNLETSEKFFTKPKDNIIANTTGWISKSISSIFNWFKSIAKSEETKSPGNKEEPQEDVDAGLVAAFMGRINVSPIRNSRLVDISMEAKDPVMAEKMTNELVNAYINQNLETKLSAAKDAVKWLSDRIDEERKKVEEAERELLKYKEDNQIITDFSSDAEKITAEKLATLNQQVVEVESKRVEAETRYQQAISLENNPDLLDSIPEVLSNDIVKEIKKMEVALYSRMSELSRKYGKNHPQMVAIDSELADLKKRKATEAKRVVNSLRNEFKLAIAREEGLKKALEDQKTESLQMNKKAIQYGVLQRQAETSRNMYDLLIKRFKETSLTEEMKTGNIRIIDRAEVPDSPVKPKKQLNLLLSIVIGLALGIGLAFFLEYLDNTIKLPDEVKNRLNIPYLGHVPAFVQEADEYSIDKDLIALHSPKSTTSESFRGIRTGIIFSSADQPPQVLLVTSAGPAEGKTFNAVNLAVIMANAGSKVLLLDCDMRKPRIHKIFGVQRETGLSNILVGTGEPNRLIIPTVVENLDVLPVGPIPPNPSEILGSKKMGSLINELKEKYDRIIMDSPPVTAVTDAVLLAPITDGVLLIIRANETPRQIIQNSIDHLKSVNAHILGGILNGIQTGRDSYYYYQYYYYYYGDDTERRKKSKKGKKKPSASIEPT